jgi:phosphohistidine swiveling domain-containing protein
MTQLLSRLSRKKSNGQSRASRGQIRNLASPGKTIGMGEVGEKARNLNWLLKNRYRVPQTFVLPFSIYDNYLMNEKAALEKTAGLVSAVIQPEGRYAVRSSANLEDHTSLSFAGQFQTYLEVSGMGNILAAVEEVWKAAGRESLQAYAQKSGQSLEGLKIAVIIQEMVKPVISGVAFSKNPLTNLNETVIEAIEGSGVQLVQEGKTPERWVYRWGDWIVKPDHSRIDTELLRQVVLETIEIAGEYGSPVDLEWVYDGENLYWVQLRPITQLEGINIYSNHISREVFPGLIKPLIWSVNVPLVNTVWIKLFTEMTGPNDLKPEDLAKSFGYRAYFNMGTIGRIFQLMGFPKESLEILLRLPGGTEKPRFKPSRKTLSLLPRLLIFGLGKLRIGRNVLPVVEKAHHDFKVLLKEPAALDDKDLTDQIDRLYAITQKVAYYNVAVPLLMSIYNSLLSRQLSKLGVDFARFDVTHGLIEMEHYDLNLHIRMAAEEFNRLEEPVQLRIAAASIVDLMGIKEGSAFHIKLVEILNRFGHFSESGNDFSAVPWRETPILMLQMVMAEARRLASLPVPPAEKGRPDTRIEEAAGHQTSEKITWQSLQVTPVRRMLIKPVYNRARCFRLYREAVSSTYTYGYGLFRGYFMELGCRFVERGILENIEDIFYLRWDEIRNMVLGTADGTPPGELVSIRKAELEASRDLTLPETIYGDEIPPLVNAGKEGSRIFTGIPSSRGYYRGPVKVIRGMADFGKLDPGDVLVIPFSDVGWTPLFTLAGAVIAESGGMLSHSSIVAREYNLPCVVSVSDACQIPDMTIVSVDGFKGEVAIHQEADDGLGTAAFR